MFSRSASLLRNYARVLTHRTSPARAQHKSFNTGKPVNLTATESTQNMLAVLGAGTLVGLVGTTVNFYQTPEQPKITKLDHLSKYFDAMHSTFLEMDNLANIPSTKMAEISKTINRSISLGNMEPFKESIERLSTLGIKNNQKYFSMLIHACAIQGKTSLLKILESKIGLSPLIQKNPLAKKLLNHSANQAIEGYSHQFTRGPGNIRYDGAHIQLAYKRDQDKQDATAQLETPPVMGLDSSEDLAAMLSYLRQQDKSNKSIDAAYDNVVILDVHSLAEGPNSLKEYLNVLKAACDQTDQPITNTLLFYGNHVTMGQVRIEKTKDGFYDVETFYLDPLGRYENAHSGFFLIEYFEKVFPEQVSYYVSEVKEQHAKVGCSVFCLMHVYDLIHFQETDKQLAKLTGCPTNNSFFDYLKKNITTTLMALAHDTEGVGIHYTYHHTLPPLAWSRGKQSMTHPGTLETCSSDKLNTTTVIIGHMGLPDEIENSPASRKSESKLPINHLSPYSLEEHIKYSVRESEGKRRNATTILEVGTWGIQLVHWLSKLTPKDIEKYKDAFSLTSFAQKKSIELQCNNELAFDEDRPLPPSPRIC